MKVEWKGSGRKAQSAPNPAYPNGIDIDVSGGKKACYTTLPYPAKECGAWILTCENCGFSAAITAAGRPDDPRSVKLPCKEVRSGTVQRRNDSESQRPETGV